ncbi:unnamed protein product [Rotaria sp. Silwood2]|nr:unnamed protein product [Rotaria sp. Silwood2]
MVIHILLLLIWCISVNTHYSLYHSDIAEASYSTFDCLHAYLIDRGKETGGRYIQNSHLISYCRRPDHDEEQEHVSYKYGENIAETITFEELKKRGVTSDQLLEWFAPIDVAESYEINKNSTGVFYNCTSPWFGSMCQYKFVYDLSLSFNDIIDVTFSNGNNINYNITSGTCYRFLTDCNNGLWPLCFDWREICDGKIDCLNGTDEQWCDQLEITQCNDNEYRCHYGGQCIPLTFARDSRISIDCLDGSDEQDYAMDGAPNIINVPCSLVTTFRCQERISRYSRSFQCGDGQYVTHNIIPTYKPHCKNKRDKELSRAMLTSMDHISSISCRKAFYCALHFNRTIGLSSHISLQDTLQTSPILVDVGNEDCEPLSQHCLSEWVVIPAHPIFLGMFQFVYLTNRSVDELKKNVAPNFVCFNAQRCPVLASKIVSIEIINGLTCCHLSNLIDNVQLKNFNQVISSFMPFDQHCLKNGVKQSCTNPSYFHCNKSMKCIPYHRVGDGVIDCHFREDEDFNACQLNDSTRFKCQSNLSKCLSLVAIGDGYHNCPLEEDEIFTYTQDLVKLVSFPDICNLNVNKNIRSLKITETDETNCTWWPCNNPYTQCDRYWHCLNGADELNCPNTKCSFNEHECTNKEFELSHCLPLAQMYEKYLYPCNRTLLHRDVYLYNETMNISQNHLSWSYDECVTSEKLCGTNHHFNTSSLENATCLYGSQQSNLRFNYKVKHFSSNEYLCTLQYSVQSSKRSYYFSTAKRLGYFPAMSINHSISPISKTNRKKNIIDNIDFRLLSYCHRGILILSGQNETKKCLCPPNYFGARCQWQNQRISLTVQLQWQSTASTTVIFQVIIMLMDEQKQIAVNHEQITYMPTRDCYTKFNIYLLYPSRPKSLSNNYSIRIDLYEKTKLDFWASWHVKIPFQFLPVNRIVTQLFIPEIRELNPCLLSCGKHGKCRRYVNKKSLFFCQCDQGYSGAYCNITHKCNCATDSLCFDSSISICSLYKFGRHCHLTHSICQLPNNPCQHNGLCVPTDDRINLKAFTCFCSEGYSGKLCENKNNQIDIRLDETTVSITSLLLLHFITTFEDAEHERITVLKKIPFDQNILTINVQQPFNILFVQIPNQYYYLTVLREVFKPSEYIYTEIQPQQRCYSINDLLNTTFLEYKYLRRVKYYPLLCRENLQMMCFYDKDLMCICDINRFSNCFLFNHTSNNDCQGYNCCENDGQCFQNNETCPTKSTCICPDCYYGAKCQFSTKGFMFSLDTILGYHIKPKISLNRQPLIIKISILISTIMLISGLISGLLSIATFRRKKPRQVGTGYYLLLSSITSIFTIIILTIKFWQLIFSQMSLINNRSILYFNCISIDFILKILLSSSEWLNACVAIERMISIIKGVHFHKKKSKKISKWIIVSVFLFTISTYIHDPIHRQLIDDIDIDEHRIWCFVRYSSSINIYNSFITLFHSLTPCSINVISALWIITVLAHNRTGVQPDQSFQQHLQHQVQQHRHLLLTPCMVILLSLPRLIISFTSGCMRSAREPWLYLIGYFVSFIPSMLTLFVFILPSRNYKNELNTMLQKRMRGLRRRS